MTLTTIIVYIIVFFLVAAAISGMFWLISNKFPEPWKMWANVALAVICIILLLIFVVNLINGNLNLGTQIRLR